MCDCQLVKIIALFNSMQPLKAYHRSFCLALQWQHLACVSASQIFYVIIVCKFCLFWRVSGRYKL